MRSNEKTAFSLKEFFLFEKENNLFSRKNKDGIYIWDLIRYDVYVALLREEAIKDPSFQKPPRAYFYFVLDVITLLWTLLFGKYKYIFFTSSRNKNRENKLYDQNAYDALNILHKDALILETFERNKNKSLYRSFIYNRITILRKPISYFIKSEDYSDLLNLIRENFDNNKLTNQRLNEIIKYYKIEYAYYKWIFKWKKIKLVFVTQNGIQKGLFAAARTLHIPVTEIQHGFIDPAHIAYNYNREIPYEATQINIPTYFFSYSQYWTTSIYYPVKKIIPIGNSALYKTSVEFTEGSPTDQPKGLVVVSADVYGEDLKKLMIEFLSYNSKIPIYFKLHPNQFHEEEHYKDAFTNYKNVHVISKNSSIHELIHVSKAVLVVKSTVVYEALHMKRIGIIYDNGKQNMIGDISEYPNVYVINNGDGLNKILQAAFDESKYQEDIFFKNFDNSLFNTFLNQFNH